MLPWRSSSWQCLGKAAHGFCAIRSVPISGRSPAIVCKLRVCVERVASAGCVLRSRFSLWQVVVIDHGGYYTLDDDTRKLYAEVWSMMDEPKNDAQKTARRARLKAPWISPAIPVARQRHGLGGGSLRILRDPLACSVLRRKHNCAPGF